MKSRVNIIDKSDHKWPKIIILGYEHIILFITHYFMSQTHNSLKQLSVTDFTIVAKDDLFWLRIVTSPLLICDVTRMWGTGIMTPYSVIVLAPTNWWKGELH